MSIYDEFDVFAGTKDTSGTRFGSQAQATLEPSARDRVAQAAKDLAESRARYRSMGRIPPLGLQLMKRLRVRKHVQDRAEAPEDEQTEAAVTSTANVGAYPVPVGGALRRTSPASAGAMGQEVIPAYPADDEEEEAERKRLKGKYAKIVSEAQALVENKLEKAKAEIKAMAKAGATKMMIASEIRDISHRWFGGRIASRKLEKMLWRVYDQHKQ